MARENCSKSDGSEIEVKVQFHQQVRDYQQLTENETGETEMRHWKDKKVENTANQKPITRLVETNIFAILYIAFRK